MNTTHYIPKGPLAGLIKSFTILQSTEPTIRNIIPETAPVMCFSVRGEAVYTVNNAPQKLETAFFSGLRKNYKKVTFSNNTEAILVKFRESSANLFLKQPVHSFFGNGAALDNFCSARQVERIQDQLTSSANNAEKISYIETFLTDMLQEKQQDKLVLAAVKKIFITNGNTRIKDLAYQAGLSLDVFEKRFRKIVGASPKQYSSIVRMSHAINNKPDERSLTSFAYDLGYFDQNHFIKDFKAFTGETPFNYFKARQMGDGDLPY